MGQQHIPHQQNLRQYSLKSILPPTRSELLAAIAWLVHKLPLLPKIRQLQYKSAPQHGSLVTGGSFLAHSLPACTVSLCSLDFFGYLLECGLVWCRKSHTSEARKTTTRTVPCNSISAIGSHEQFPIPRYGIE